MFSVYTFLRHPLDIHLNLYILNYYSAGFRPGNPMKG